MFSLLLALACARHPVVTPPPPPPPVPEVIAPAPPPPGPGYDVARRLWRVAACGGSDPIPERFDAAVVQAHCDALLPGMADFRKTWVEVAEAFFAPIRPPDLPTTVIYPFGGGDLLSALAVFPDATHYVTMSLEASGDAAAIDALPPERLAKALEDMRTDVLHLFRYAHSKTTSLQANQRADLPGELVFDMAALVVHGQEPLSLRYFTIDSAGLLHYTDSPGPTFHHVEITFKPMGEVGPVRTFRHLNANLDNVHLARYRGTLAWLRQQGDVAAMTKAASFLLWADDFSTIRNYLVEHAVWMASDSTGILPSDAEAAGLVQEVWGEYDGAFIRGIPAQEADMRSLWLAQSPRDLPFRFGYPDNRRHNHLLVTRRP